MVRIKHVHRTHHTPRGVATGVRCENHLLCGQRRQRKLPLDPLAHSGQLVRSAVGEEIRCADGEWMEVRFSQSVVARHQIAGRSRGVDDALVEALTQPAEVVGVEVGEEVGVRPRPVEVVLLEEGVLPCEEEMQGVREWTDSPSAPIPRCCASLLFEATVWLLLAISASQCFAPSRF